MKDERGIVGRQGRTTKSRRTRRKQILLLDLPASLTRSPRVSRTAYCVILLVLAGLALLLVYARPLTATVTVGGEGDRAAVLNFFDRERSPAGVPYRWTRERSTIIFRGAGLAFPINRPPDLQLTLVDGRPAGVAQPRVTIAVNETVDFGQRPALPGEQQVRFPAAPIGGGPTDARVTIGTAANDIFTPPGDKRALGVAVLGEARLDDARPATARFFPAIPPFGAWWRWLATVAAAWGCALALLRRPERAALAGGALLLALTLAAAVDRLRFWQLIHLPLVALLALLPVLWRRDLARLATRLLAAARERLGLAAPTLTLLALLPAGAAQALLTHGRTPAWLRPVVGNDGGPKLALALYVIGAAGVLTTLRAGLAERPPPAPQIWGEQPHSDQEVPPKLGGQGGATESLLLAAILLLAAGARFYRLADIPFGLWRDEARHGLEALRFLREPGYRPVYIPAISLPGLYPGLLALVFKVFGVGIGSLRGLTAAAGVGAVGLLWAVARRLWGPRVALVAALLAAVGSWRVSIDRLAFDTAPTTLCTLAAFYAFLRGIEAIEAGRRGLPAFAAAGLCGGLAIYGYYPGRFALPVLAGATLVLLITRGRRPAPRLLASFTLCLAVAALTLIPLGRYAVERPNDFFKRTEQVYLLADSALEGRTKLEAVERNLVVHAVMFNWRGEPNARHHAPKWPMLDAVTALCFAIGLALAVAAAIGGEFAAFFTLGWFLALLAPSIVSVDAPSAVRAQDAAPAAYLLAALGFVALWDRLRAADAPASLRRATPALGALALTVAVGINLWLYFLRLPDDPRVLGKFQYVGETRAGRSIAAEGSRSPGLVAYVPKPFVGSEVLAFTADGVRLDELPSDPAALAPGPIMIVVPKAEGQDFARQTDTARRLAGAAGLREVPGERPPGGGEPVYVAFVRDGR